MSDQEVFFKNLIFLDYMTNSKEDLFNSAAEYLLQTEYIDEKEAFLSGLWKRESEYSTAIGDSIAIPHCLSDTVQKSFVAYFSLTRPIEWKSSVSDENKVSQVFMIGVSDSRSDTHLRILSLLARNLMHEDFKNKLFNADSTDEVYELLTSYNCRKEE